MSYLLFLISRENSYLFISDIRPLDELLPPLHDRNAVISVVSKGKSTPPEQERTDEDVQSTRQDFLIVHAAVMPTRVFPAPQGSTMIPERARLESCQSADQSRGKSDHTPITKHLT